MPARMNGTTIASYAHGRRHDRGQPAEGDRLERHPRWPGSAARRCGRRGSPRSDRRDDESAWPVHGRVRRAGLERAVNPVRPGRNWLSRKIDPNIPKYIRSETTLAALNAPAAEETTSQHRVGLARFSQIHEADEQGGFRRRSLPDHLRAAPSPDRLPLITPQTRARRPALTRPSPGNVRAGCPCRSSRSGGRRPGGSTMSPIGTFDPERSKLPVEPSAMAPPTSGPIAIARPGEHHPRPPSARTCASFRRPWQRTGWSG